LNEKVPAERPVSVIFSEKNHGADLVDGQGVGGSAQVDVSDNQIGTVLHACERLDEHDLGFQSMSHHWFPKISPAIIIHSKPSPPSRNFFGCQDKWDELCMADKLDYRNLAGGF
jgi:hypothetical protein